MDQFAVAAIGLAGALLGVVLQWTLSQRTAVSGRHQELLIDTYQRFIEATAALAGEVRSGSSSGVMALTQLIAAKQKIAYFAPADVVSALAAFGRTSQSLGQADADRAFAILLKTMRQSLRLDAVNDADLTQVLFGKDQV